MNDFMSWHSITGPGNDSVWREIMAGIIILNEMTGILFFNQYFS